MANDILLKKNILSMKKNRNYDDLANQFQRIREQMDIECEKYLVSCGNFMVDAYVNYICDAELKKMLGCLVTMRRVSNLVLAYDATFHLTLRLLYGIQTSGATRAL